MSRDDQPYSKREMDDKFGSLEHRLFDEQEGYLPRIERQTTKTNGRVNRHDRILLVLGTALVMYLCSAYPSIISLISHFL